MNEEYEHLKRDIYEDGIVDDTEVQFLRGLIEKSNYGEDEVQLLLDLNNVLEGESLNPLFVDLLVEAVSTFVVDPSGSIPDEKVSWLKDHLLKDGQVDENERRIIKEISRKAASLPQALADLT